MTKKLVLATINFWSNNLLKISLLFLKSSQIFRKIFVFLIISANFLLFLLKMPEIFKELLKHFKIYQNLVIYSQNFSNWLLQFKQFKGLPCIRHGEGGSVNGMPANDLTLFIYFTMEIGQYKQILLKQEKHFKEFIRFSRNFYKFSNVLRSILKQYKSSANFSNIIKTY